MELMSLNQIKQQVMYTMGFCGVTELSFLKLNLRHTIALHSAFLDLHKINAKQKIPAKQSH